MTPFNGLLNVRRLLLLGAHADDIEIGAGGTVLRLLDENPTVEVNWVCFSGNDIRRSEARQSADDFLKGRGTFVCHSFTDTMFPSELKDIKSILAGLRAFEPDLILTHSLDDRHQDHRAINEATWNVFRANQILEYEIPKWDGDLQRPNVYVGLTRELIDAKNGLLLKHFRSQQDKHWFDDETFRSLARLRGLESNCRYAEAFVARKLVI